MVLGLNHQEVRAASPKDPEQSDLDIVKADCACRTFPAGKLQFQACVSKLLRYIRVC